MEARVLVACAALASAGAFLPPASASEPTKDECIDANETAQGLLRSGKIIAAKQRLLVCVARTCPGPVRDDCSLRLNDVEAKTPTLVFDVRSDADGDLSTVRVTVDDQPLVDRLDGTAVAVDPGEHRFVFHAEGFSDEERTLVIHEGDKNRREHVVLVRSSPPAAPAAPASPVPAGGEQAHAEAPTELGTQRMIALGLGGAGAVGLAVGGIFALVSKSTYDNALQNDCQGRTNGCSPVGVSDGKSAHDQATIATVGFVAGALLLASGAVLYFTVPKAGTVAVAPTANARGGGLALRAAW